MIAIGGGDLTAAKPVLKLIFDAMGRRKDARMVVMTVATNQVDGAYEKYNSIFRKKSICHIEMVDVSVREDSSNPKSLEKIERADLIFFTGGNQLNVTSLFGGSPMHEL
ncbi:MAG: cyanophycinase, partial [Acidobacteria bacterium]|nr:cyanophycinase [Acidobacteriota bacterium]